MSKINSGRLVSGGLVAAAIFFVIAGIINGGILHAELEAWMQGMNGLMHPLPQSTAMCLWALMCLIQGIAGVWIYAGIRPRYGAGPKTAVLAGLLLWLAAKLPMALDIFALGLIPCRILAAQLIGSFVACLLGIFVGAWVYRE